jgi:hypothetical protein
MTQQKVSEDLWTAVAPQCMYIVLKADTLPSGLLSVLPGSAGDMTESSLEARAREGRVSTSSEDARWRGLYRLSGILLVMSGAGGFVVYLLSARLYASGVPTDATGYLQLFSQHQLLAATDWGLWIFGDFWLLPVAIALYLVLRRINNSLALVGSILSIVYVLFDICVTELNSLTLVVLSQGYASATSDALRAPFVAAATYAVAALPIQTFFSFTIGAVGWLFWSLLMPKSFFGWATAIFGVIVNVMGIFGGVGALMPASSPFYLLGLFTIFGALFTAVWFIVVGAQLYRYGTHLPVVGVKPPGASA